MRNQVAIGISGFIGSGKTSVSNWFIQNHGFRRVSFADPIRNMMMTLGLTEHELRDPIKKEQPHPLLAGRSPRHAMETLGTNWGRDLIHPHFWVGQLANQISDIPFIICDDVRFQNEIEFFKQYGGKVFRLSVPGRKPRVHTDNMVEKLTDVIDLVNDFEHGGVTTKMLYQTIYDQTMGARA